LIHEASGAKDLAKQRRTRSADHAGLEVEEHRAGHLLAALGLVVERAGAVDLRVVVAELLSVASTSQKLVPIWLPHWPPEYAKSRANKQPGGGEHAGK